MSLFKLESFDDGLWATRGSVGGAPVVSSLYGLHGNGIRLGDNQGTSLGYGMPVAAASGAASVFIGFACRVTDGNAGNTIMRFGGAGGIFWDNAGSRFYAFGDGSVGGDAFYYSPTVALNQWHYIELEIKYGNSSNGTIRFWMDGQLVDGTDTFDYVQGFGAFDFAGSFAADIDECNIDDLYIVDSSDGIAPIGRLGPVNAQLLLPNGNGNSSDLTGQDADKINNYANVDENPPDAGTTWNESATAGDKDTYGFSDLAGTPEVLAMTVGLYAIKTDTGVKFFKPVVRTKTVQDYTTQPTITASSQFTTFSPDKAWRTNASYWVSAVVSATEWWRADFGSAKDFGRIDLEILAGGGTYPTLAELQWSDDDLAWNSGSEQISISGAGSYQIPVSPDVIGHRYWRILFSSFSGASGMELDNVYFYEVSATLDDQVGDGLALAESYNLLEIGYGVNPGTGKALGYVGVNAMEFGVEVSDDE